MPADWISGHEVAHDADLLFHDAQYGDEEYPRHVGWGHSAIDHVLEFADKLGVDHLVLFHHDPYHTDEELDAMLAAALARRPAREKVCLAYEGMRFTLDANGVVQTADMTA
jgi:ribonuclease BN (tRNA processing enzyme)